MSKTAIKERPITFDTEMVQAILDGRKMQTRQICQPQPYSVGDEFSSSQHKWLMIRNSGENWERQLCPYGSPTDRLWVQEEWKTRHGSNWLDIEYKSGWYAKTVDCYLMNELKFLHGHWRSPIRMPRWASRITLEITDVRVERVQDISPQDCWAEGIGPVCHGEGLGNPCDEIRARQAFQDLWDSINAEKGFGWDVNPWVWVISFKKVT